MSPRSRLDGYTSCDATYRRGYCLPYDIDLQASQPQFEDGSVYRQNRPTKAPPGHCQLLSTNRVSPCTRR